jgi:hypothetical protein
MYDAASAIVASSSGTPTSGARVRVRKPRRTSCHSVSIQPFNAAGGTKVPVWVRQVRSVRQVRQGAGAQGTKTAYIDQRTARHPAHLRTPRTPRTLRTLRTLQWIIRGL